jgi:hypothetical protein
VVLDEMTNVREAWRGHTFVLSAKAAEFNYQQTLDGVDAAVDSYSLDTSRFHTSVENDWTLIGIAPSAEAKWGTIKLEAVDTSVDAFVKFVCQSALLPPCAGDAGADACALHDPMR